MSEANPFGTEDGTDPDETGADGGTGADSKNLADVRAWGRGRDKAAKDAQAAADAALAKVAAFETKEAAGKVFDTLKGLNIAPDKAPEVMATLGTSESVRDAVLEAFKSSGAVAPADPAAGDAGAAPAEPAAPAAGSEGFTPVSPGSPAPLTKLTLADVDKLLREGDNDAVEKAWAEGRVERLAKNDDGSLQVDWLEGMR